MRRRSVAGGVSDFTSAVGPCVDVIALKRRSYRVMWSSRETAFPSVASKQTLTSAGRREPGQSRARRKSKSTWGQRDRCDNERFRNQLVAKRLEVLQQAVPAAKLIGLLVNPNNLNAEPDADEARAAAN